VKKLMYQAPELWSTLMTKLVDQVTSYLTLQIDAGVEAVQLFDTWVGALSVSDFQDYVLPHLTRLIDNLRGRVPVIYFGTGNGHLLADSCRAAPDVLALDWRVPLGRTWSALGVRAVQGNLDPIVLCADRATVARQAQRVLDEAAGQPGHVFNLGHGIVPETPVDNVRYLVEFVHERSRRAS
jgi:uroporphyrinogen decarboxylase